MCSGLILWRFGMGIRASFALFVGDKGTKKNISFDTYLPFPLPPVSMRALSLFFFFFYGFSFFRV